jgi:muconate cycloisomerase
MGPNRQIRIDANEAWTLQEAVSRLADLKPFGIAWVEQPMPVESDADLETLRNRSGVRVMLDESLCGPLDAEHLVAGKRVDLFNLRLSKCGGFIPTLRLLATARNAGLSAQLGCQVGETGILSAAGRHFAQSVSGLEAVEGSFDRYLVGERLTREDLTFGWGGKAPPLLGPGLGVSVDDAALQRVAVRRVVIDG